MMTKERNSKRGEAEFERKIREGLKGVKVE